MDSAMAIPRIPLPDQAPPAHKKISEKFKPLKKEPRAVEWPLFHATNWLKGCYHPFSRAVRTREDESIYRSAALAQAFTPYTLNRGGNGRKADNN